jgi:hypothetical protein
MLCFIVSLAGCTEQNTVEQHNNDPSESFIAVQSVDVLEHETPATANEEAYIAAYKDFLLNHDFTDDNGFPVFAYYLFNMDFDRIPELGVLYHSGGSLGGYFTYYRFDGNGIVPILNNEGTPVSCSDQTLILGDAGNNKTYLLKEMYLLQGNENGKYGYVREAISRNGVLSVLDVLDLCVDEKSDINMYSDNSYFYEDDFLSDSELDECLITRYLSNGEWKEITSEEYLKLKRELIPAADMFIDLLDSNVCITMYDSIYEASANGEYQNVLITADDVEELLSKWLQFQPSIQNPPSNQPEPTMPIDIPGLHLYEINARLHEGMPEYRFVAKGILNEADDWAYGYVIGLEIYDSNNTRILTADFSDVQDGEITGYHVYNEMMDTMGLHIVDVNFDGYEDVIILNTYAGAHGNTWYDCWLWDIVTSSFVASKSFAEICNPAVDPEKECIYSAGGSGAAYWGGCIYRFIDGEFILTNELDTGWDGLVEYELVNGKMEIVREVTYDEDAHTIEAEQEYYRSSELWQLDDPRWYWVGGHVTDQWLGG